MKISRSIALLLSLIVSNITAFVPSNLQATRRTGPASQQLLNAHSSSPHEKNATFGQIALITATAFSIMFHSPLEALAAQDRGASDVSNSKIQTGGASTLQSGRTIAITRGVNLDRSDFSGQNMKGVAFQQSIVRDANFKGANLFGASFFDATVDGSNFDDTDMTQVNLEMAQLSRATMRNTVAREMYVGGATIFDGIKDIENSDWTDTFLSKYQKKLLCGHPTAKGTNPVTGVDTRESLQCTD
jgi:uncharacterized protein YjbI with pentapeptide repeats